MPFFFWLDIVALSISAVLASALVLMVLGVGPERALNRFFALVALSQAFWAGFALFLRLGLRLEAGNLPLLTELSVLSGAFSGPLLFAFTVRYVDVRSRWTDRASVLGLALLFILSVPLFQHTMVSDPHLGANGLLVVKFSTLGLVVALIPAFYMIWSLYLFWREHRRLSESYLALSVLVLVAGFFVEGVLQIEFPVMSITNTSSMLLLGYAVTGQQIFNPLRKRNIEMQREIAGRIKVEEALREKTEELDRYFSYALDLLCIADLDGHFRQLNKEWETALGYAVEELEGQRFLDFVHPEDLEATVKALSRLAAQQKVLSFTNRYRHRDGSYRWIEWRSLPMENLIYAVARDITNRKQTEDTLRKSEERFRTIFDAVNDALVVYEPSVDTVLDANREALEMFGYSREELFQASIRALISSESPCGNAEALKWVKKATEGEPQIFEWKARHKDGHRFWLEVNMRQTVIGGEERILLAMRDVTERKKAEEEIQRRNVELVILNQAGQVLNRLLEPTEIAELIYAMVGWMLDNSNFYIALYDETNRQIRFPVYTVAGRRQRDTSRSFGNGLTEYVLQTQTLLSIPSGVSEALEELGVSLVGTVSKCLLAAPMLIGDKAIGVIAIQDYEHENAYQDTHAELLMMIATQAAGALENARLYQQAQQEISERKRAEDMLKRRAAQLAILNDVGKQISAELELDSVLDRATHLIQENFGYHHVAIFTVDQEQTRAVMKTRAGSFIDLFPTDHYLKLGQGMVGWVAKHGERLLANDVRAEPRHVNFYPDVLLTRSELDVPIRIGQEIVGVLDIQSPQLDDFDENDVMVIETLAGQIATAMENARLYESVQKELNERKRAEEILQQYAVRLKTLRDIDQAILAAETPQAIAQAAVDHLRELIPCHRISVSLNDDERNEIELIVVSGRTQMGAGSRFSSQDYGIDDLQSMRDEVSVWDDWSLIPQLPKVAEKLLAEGIRSVVNIPLSYRGKVVGALNLGSTEPAAFNEEQIEIAREAADQLGIAIQQAYLHEQVQRHAVELEERVAERTEELIVAYEELQALSHVKDEFVSNVSHELRTPIASLKLFVHLLTVRPEKQASYIASLKRESDRLSELIEGLLMLSRLDQDHVAMDLAPFDLNALVQEYVADRALLAANRKLELALELDTELPELKGDRNLLGQVLSILLTNAFNYTPEGGQVTVSTLRGKDNQECGFCVADTGPGILLEERTRLFDRFYRGSAAKASKTPGTGLGLAIAREIVNRHRGRIEVQSDGVPGCGAQFSVWLPVNSLENSD